MSLPQCGFRIREAFRQERYCLNPAAWVVWYTTPDDGKTMRKRECTHRCFWHTDDKFLPQGATQIEAIASVSPLGASVEPTA
jgi:hypothetical protein